MAASDPLAWANESLAIARESQVKYCVLNGATCRYSASKKTYTGGPKRIVNVTASYLQMNEPVVAERLKQAGVRLAGVLNAAFQ